MNLHKTMDVDITIQHTTYNIHHIDLTENIVLSALSFEEHREQSTCNAVAYNHVSASVSKGISTIPSLWLLMLVFCSVCLAFYSFACLFTGLGREYALAFAERGASVVGK